ncbi:hypothetical protein ACFUIT_11185 [Streptomyces sp. NPDC057239]|uniref:hypothetical protein n=1 Tax=Streptomyces sp. NPDC057239 TaxID=3346061 RepID=UPI003643D9EC
MLRERLQVAIRDVEARGYEVLLGQRMDGMPIVDGAHGRLIHTSTRNELTQTLI